MKFFLFLLFALPALAKPNIILILADDMGWGDTSVLNSSSQIATPNLEALAAKGCSFTNAHSPSSVCSPTRWSILTGNFPYRSKLKDGDSTGFFGVVRSPYEGQLFEDEDVLLPETLQKFGYTTACFGKWHLGTEWNLSSGSYTTDARGFKTTTTSNIDFSKPYVKGPLDYGFDDYFGMLIPNGPPYAFIQDRSIVGATPTGTTRPLWSATDGRSQNTGTAGPTQAGFYASTVPNRICEEVESYIAAATEPYFIYYAMTQPHTPIVFADSFAGLGGAGDWGRAVMELDSHVGRVMAAVEAAGQTNNTIIIFSSDNGSPGYTDNKYTSSNALDFAHMDTLYPSHETNGPYKGWKATIWDGGHRVPLIVSWPTKFKQGQTTSKAVVLTDLYATICHSAGASYGGDVALDSWSHFWGLIGSFGFSRGSFPVLSGSGHEGWVYQDTKRGLMTTGTGFSGIGTEGTNTHGTVSQLFDLASDQAQASDILGSNSAMATAIELDNTRMDAAQRTAAPPLGAFVGGTSATVTKVYILAGQSNEEGRGLTSSAPASYSTQDTSLVQVWTGTDLEVFDFGTNHDFGTNLSNTANFGIESELAKMIQADGGGVIVRWAKGGTGLGASHASTWSTWGEDRNKLREAVFSVRSQLGKIEWVEFYFGQGEADANDSNANDPAVYYEDSLNELIEDVRGWTRPDLPVVIRETTITTTGYGKTTAVNTAKNAVATADPLVSIVDTTGLSQSDGIHFDATGMVTLAERVVDEFE